jgi:predicted RND superfamily exporter protein
MINSIVNGTMKFRWLLIFVLAALVYLASTGAGLLGFSGDYRDYMAADNPQLESLQHLLGTYDKSDNLMIVLAPQSGKVFSNDSLSALKWATEKAWNTPFSVRAESIVNFQHIESTAEELVIADLISSPNALTASQLAYKKKVAVNEPQLVNRLISPQGHVAAINVVYHLPGISPFENFQVVMFARQLASEIESKYPNVDVHLTGMAMYNHAFAEAAMADAANLTPLAYLVIGIAVLVLLRSIFATAAAVLVVFLSVISAQGLAGYLGMSITSLSASAPLIILTIGVADAVHLLSAMLKSMRLGNGKFTAISQALKETFVPITVTSLATSIAFLSLNFSEIPPFHDLGNMVTMGIVIAWALSLFLLPAVVMLLPLRASKKPTKEIAVMSTFGRWVANNANKLFLGAIPVAVLLISLSANNELNDMYLKWFDAGSSFRVDNDFTEKNLTGLYNIEYSLQANTEDGIASPEYLQVLSDYTQWLREQPQVIHVLSLSDTVKRINRSLHSDLQEYYRIPDSPQLAAQSLLLYEQSLPYGLDLNNQIDVQKKASRVVVSLHQLSTKEMLAFEQKSLAWLAEKTTVEANAASITLIFAHIGQRNIESMLTGILWTAALIALVLCLVFRSVKLGLLSMIPNILPIVMTYGVWAVFVGQIGFSIAIVTTMTLGIVVDNTIHMMYTILRKHRDENMNMDDAIADSISSVGLPLIITSISLVAGFIVLGTSGFALNREMGIVTALTLSIAVVADFMMIPGLLKFFANSNSTQESKDESPTHYSTNATG